MKIVPQKYRIAFVLNTLYYPFTYPEILKSLKSRGYAILASAPPKPFLNGARNYVSGYIASKSGCFIELNDDRKIIAVEADSIDHIVSSAKDIIDLSMADFQLSMAEDMDYVELFSAAVVSDSGNPAEAIRRFSGDQYSKFDEIMGVESSGYSIRIVPRNSLPVNKDWFDISITPRFSTADREYYVEVVFRREKNIDDVLDFTAQLETKMSAIIGKIGGS